MNVIATIDPESAPELEKLLKEHQIEFQTKTVTEETGFDVTGFMVNDDVYDTACNLVEEWQAAAIEQVHASSSNRCPSCRSANLEYAEDIDYDKTVTKIQAIYRCKDCGYIFAKR